MRCNNQVRRNRDGWGDAPLRSGWPNPEVWPAAQEQQEQVGQKPGGGVIAES